MLFVIRFLKALCLPLGLVVGWFGFWACATPTHKTSRTEHLKKQMSAAQKQKLDEYRAEIDIGRNMAGRLLAFYGVVDDDVLVDYVNQVGLYVAGFGDHPERKYMFHILDSDSVNAFACPGGYILITKGALKAARNEAELAHILGHEVAHVGLKHMFDSLKSMSAEEIDKAAAEAEEAARSLSPAQKARLRPKVEENEAGALIARYLSGSVAGLNVLSAAKAGMSLILEKGLGAEKEFEADAEGTKYAIRAGYDPKALMDYLCRLENEKKSKGRCDISKLIARRTKGDKKASKQKTVLDKTHPPTKQRIAFIHKRLKDLDAIEALGARGTQRFTRIRQRALGGE